MEIVKKDEPKKQETIARQYFKLFEFLKSCMIGSD